MRHHSRYRGSQCFHKFALCFFLESFLMTLLAQCCCQKCACSLLRRLGTVHQKSDTNMGRGGGAAAGSFCPHQWPVCCNDAPNACGKYGLFMANVAPSKSLVKFMFSWQKIEHVNCIDKTWLQEVVRHDVWWTFSCINLVMFLQWIWQGWNGIPHGGSPCWSHVEFSRVTRTTDGLKYPACPWIARMCNGASP